MSTANININLDSKKAEKSLKDLNKSVQENGKSTESLRIQLRKLTQELQTLEPGTQRFKELTVQTGELRDRIKDTTDIINAAAGSPMENLGKGLANTTEIGIKGFQGIAGAMALVTGNDKQLQELFFRLQAIQGVVQSIQYFGQLGDTINQIKANFAAFGQSVSGGGSAVAEYTSATVEAASAVTDITQSTKTAAAANKILEASQLGLTSVSEDAVKVYKEQAKAVSLVTTEAENSVKRFEELINAREDLIFDMARQTQDVPSVFGTYAEQEAANLKGVADPKLYQERKAALEKMNAELAAISKANQSLTVPGVKESYQELEKLSKSITQTETVTKIYGETAENISEIRRVDIELLRLQNELDKETLLTFEGKKEFDKEKVKFLKEEISNYKAVIEERGKDLEAQTKQLTSLGLLDSERKKQIAGLNAEADAKKAATVATEGLSTATKVLIGVGIVVALAAATYAIYQYWQETSKAAEEAKKFKKEQENLKKVTKEAGESIAEETSEFLSLILALKATNSQSKERSSLIKEINSTYGTTLKNLKDEFKFQEQVNGVLSDYIEFQRVKYRLQANEARTQKLFAEEETLTWKVALEGQKQLAEFKKQEFRATKEQIKETEKSLKLENLIANYKSGTLAASDYQYENIKRIVEIQGTLESLGVSELALKKKLGTYSYKDKDDKNKVDNQNKITIAFEESTKALLAYQEALKTDSEKPLELTNYEIEVQKLTNGLKALESKRVAAYEEEKKNAEGLYKDKQITKEVYDAKLVKAEDTFEKEKTKINELYANKRAEFDKNWTEEQLLISKKAIADKTKITAQSQLDELARERDNALKNIALSTDTEIKKAKDTLLVKQKYNDASYDLILERRDAELAALDIQYQQDISNINLNAEEKEKITAQYEATKVKLNADANTQITTNENEVTAAIADEFDVRTQALNEFKSVYDSTADSLSDALTTAISGDLDSVGASFRAFTEALIQEAMQFEEIGKKWDDLDLKGKVAAVSEAATQAATIATQVVGALYQKQQDDEAAATQERYETEDRELAESLENKLISQEEYDSTVKRNEYTRATEDKQARRESFEQQKKLARANAVIGVANAVIQALATLPPPFSYVSAGISAGMGAAELSIIDRQKFRAARGGVVPGNGSPTIDSVDALLAPGEMVINARSSSMFPSLLSNINMAGGGIPLAPQVPVQPQVTQSVFTKQNEVRAYVVESDISSSQRRVSRLERNGSF